MSNLLEQASLVLIPSGYKEDVVYSEIPLDGSGDLQFTRSSNGTRINSAGLVEEVPWNLLQQSETFDSAPWTANNATITANSTTAPNGTTTADTFTLTAGVDAGVYQAVNGVSNNYTISVYAKYVSGDKYLFIFGPLNSQGAKIWFDIQNGTVSNQLSGFTGTIENAGNGWYKCSIYNTSQAVLDYIQFGISTTNSNRVLSNNSVSYFWGAQVNSGTAKPYFPTTDRLNVPRLTYQNGGGGCPSLLLEKQSTNVFVESENLFTTHLVQNLTTSGYSNVATSPDGTQNADKFVPNSTSGVHGIANGSSLSITSGQAYSFSVFVKSDGGAYNLISLTFDSATAWGATKNCIFNASTGASYSVPSGATMSSQDMGNGWYRITATLTATGSVSSSLYQYRIYIADANGNLSWAASSGNTNGIFVWGAQLENSSYPTSYIPTTSASATRVTDACYKTGISSLIGQTEGVLFADVNRIQKSQNYNVAIFIGLWPSVIDVYFDNSNQIICIVYVSGVLQTTLNGGVLANGRHKIAVAYKQNDFVMYVDGAQVATSSSGSVPTCSQLIIGNDDSTLYHLNDSINEAVIFPTRLTNAELASLTTI